MQTEFSISQLAKTELSEAERVLRKCVHCGFCLATCPTYLLLGDERDSPRGRIYMIKDMLETETDADSTITRHIDRCLSCLSCVTTCPAGVDYMHLVDTARSHINQTYTRPVSDRLLRWLLTYLLPRPNLFRLAVLSARAPALLGQFLPGSFGALMRLSLRPVHAPSWVDKPQVIASDLPIPKKRVALLNGCVQKVLAPQINEAAARVLSRHGCEVTIVRGAFCCGAISLHHGEKEKAKAMAKGNIDAYLAEHQRSPLDALVALASGCGTMVKDYGNLFNEDPEYAKRAKQVALLTQDVTEVLLSLGGELKIACKQQLRIAYHGACSLQHGQKVHEQPIALLKQVGLSVQEPAEGHLCCGSAGTYNIRESHLANQMLNKKINSIEKLDPDVIVTGNIGCMTQIATGTHIPVVHTVEILDWATGGPTPPALSNYLL